MRLHTSGTRIVDANGAPILLRGFNIIPVWEDNPGATWGPDTYRAIRARGFNTVRMVLHWQVLEPRRGQFDLGALAVLDRAVQHARDAGLYVVLDIIHLYDEERFVPSWARTGDALRSVEVHGHGVVAMLAGRYRDNPAVAAYDPVNEPPAYPPDQNRVLRMYDRLIATIRRVDPGKIVMIEPAYGDSSMANADLRLLRDRRNVVFSLHDYYAGGAGDGYRPNGEQDNQFNGTGQYAWDGKAAYVGNPRELEAHLRVTLDTMHAAGIPVWIGEFAINPGAAGGRRWIRDKLALFRRHRLGYAWWHWGKGDAMAVLGRSGGVQPFVDLLR
jgi:hypothetical protein